ncbi:MAG: hypothetical protein IKQ11_03955 [Paludibacteraceae bacterium]|nr:hypothetical protein [Paludibacteraceae bacterium]
MRVIILFISIIAGLFKLGGTPEVVYQEGPYSRAFLTDSTTTIEYYEYATDSSLVVLTVCAPQCSSCARVYNKEGELIRTITPPFTSIFPLAHIENGQLIWENNDTWEY